MINVAVEGESDRELAKAVVSHAGHQVHLVRVAGGKTRLDPLIPKYNIASAVLAAPSGSTSSPLGRLDR